MNGRITLAHGNGGKMMHELIDAFRVKFSSTVLNELADAAELNIRSSRIAFSTDSYVVKPLFFPGGDIGKLAVCGTVNDLAMRGARPLYISLAFIIEEGLELSVLMKVADSIKKAAKKAHVKIVTGDLKVVEKGAADKMFINTAGIGVIEGKVGIRPKSGDIIIINGSLAEHGIAVLNARENLGFSSKIKSDCTNVNLEVQRCMKASSGISVMRDPTRGGLITTLNELAEFSNLDIEIHEDSIVLKEDVRKLCDILGLDPLYVANEGKFICFVRAKDANKIKRAIGRKAAIIGRVRRSRGGRVYLKTKIGALRIMPMLEVDQLPRIC